ncbi:MAG: MurR/RpiR family transcriptional regulator [Geminicoccaceae bacterium]
MNKTNVPFSGESVPEAVLASLAEQLATLTPELRKAAAYVLENPNDIGVSSIREIADAAEVKPNSFVRMARAVGFEGYDDFREPFREEIRQGSVSFPDRARWLQSLARGGRLGGLYADMASAAIRNVEQTFAYADARSLKAAADAIVEARHAYILGDGMNHALARNFSYLAGMAMDRVEAIPREGRLAIDHLVRAGPGDILLAMTFKPYRRDVVEAVEVARGQGVAIIGISDSLASPIVAGSAHGFVVQIDTPQFFPSIAAAAALLETLMAFVIADAEPDVIASIERFHESRRALGIYREEGRSSS